MADLALFLLGKKGFDVLSHLVKHHPNTISDVVGTKDLGIDHDYYPEIQSLCKENGIRYHDRLNSSFSIKDHNGYILVIGWRWIIPQNNSLIIIHDSLLPKYRGFAPLVNCLINGETELGATALFAANDYDSGSIITQASRKISYPIKIKDAIDLMSEMYIQIAQELINKITANEPLYKFPQSDEAATYSLWRDEEDYWIDWQKSSVEIVRFINAVGSPYAGARCNANETQVIVHSAEAVPDKKIVDRKSSVGKVAFIDEGFPVVVCGSGLLKIKEMTSKEGNSILPLAKFRTRFNSNR
jgi:methionyl-tRNA formyltransferase